MARFVCISLIYDLLVRLDTLRSDQLQSIILKNTSSNPVYIKPKNDSVIHRTHLLSICVDRVPQYYKLPVRQGRWTCIVRINHIICNDIDDEFHYINIM